MERNFMITGQQLEDWEYVFAFPRPTLPDSEEREVAVVDLEDFYLLKEAKKAIPLLIAAYKAQEEEIKDLKHKLEQMLAKCLNEHCRVDLEKLVFNLGLEVSDSDKCLFKGAKQNTVCGLACSCPRCSFQCR